MEGLIFNDNQVVRSSGEGQVSDSQVKVKSQEFAELDIGGHETCYIINEHSEATKILLKPSCKPQSVFMFNL